jgi:predicted adenylyl cyclase CyaB
MPANIEIKAVLHNRPAALAAAARIADSGPEIIHQEDIFFRCEGARLKLRIFDPQHGELIRYERRNVTGARLSRYSIARTSTPHVLLDILTRTLAQVGRVRKVRTLYLAGQTRIHIDQVEGLGDFLELEVVLRDGQTEDDGKRIAADLFTKLGITQQSLVAEAYIDLLTRQAT